MSRVVKFILLLLLALALVAHAEVFDDDDANFRSGIGGFAFFFPEDGGFSVGVNLEDERCVLEGPSQSWSAGGIPATPEEAAAAATAYRLETRAGILLAACDESVKSITRAYSMIRDAVKRNHSAMAHPLPIATCSLAALRAGLPEMYGVYTETQEELLAAINAAEVSPPWTEQASKYLHTGQDGEVCGHTLQRHCDMVSAIHRAPGHTSDMDAPVVHYTIYWGYEDEDAFLRRRMDHWVRHKARFLYDISREDMDSIRPPHPRTLA